MFAGKWNNLFTTTVMATNPAETEMHVTNVYVQFQQGEPVNISTQYS